MDDELLTLKEVGKMKIHPLFYPSSLDHRLLDVTPTPRMIQLSCFGIKMRPVLHRLPVRQRVVSLHGYWGVDVEVSALRRNFRSRANVGRRKNH
jgi:hypothetical protein